MTTVEQWQLNESQFWLRAEQPESPVSYDDETGMWNVYGYAEVQEVLSDPATFSSDTTKLAKSAGLSTEGNLVRMDPPEHTKLRKLVSHAFTPKVVADLEPRIVELTNELLDDVDDRMELVTSLAYPLPVIVIAELLGVPSSDRAFFKEVVDKAFDTNKMFSLKDPTEEQERYRERAVAEVRKLTDYLREHARDRQQHPREDLLTKLVESEVDGERLGLDGAANFGLVLLIAGHITTTMLLGNTVLCLDAHPEIFAETRADRSRVPAVIEESLRFLSPFGAVARVTTRETELGGTAIPADQFLMAWIAAANRDSRQFPDAHVFNPSRQPNSQIAFGRGIHFCLGAPLARLEGKLALNVLLDRFPTIRTDPDEQPEFLPHPALTGVRRLPLLLS